MYSDAYLPLLEPVFLYLILMVAGIRLYLSENVSSTYFFFRIAHFFMITYIFVDLNTILPFFS